MTGGLHFILAAQIWPWLYLILSPLFPGYRNTIYVDLSHQSLRNASAEYCAHLLSDRQLWAVRVSLCRLLLKLCKHQGAELLEFKLISKFSESSVIKSSQQLFCLSTLKFTPRVKAHGYRRQSPGRGGKSSDELVQVPLSQTSQSVPLRTRCRSLWVAFPNVSSLWSRNKRSRRKAFLNKKYVAPVIFSHVTAVKAGLKGRSAVKIYFKSLGVSKC